MTLWLCFLTTSAVSGFFSIFLLRQDNFLPISPNLKRGYPAYVFKFCFSIISPGASQVAQWKRIHLPMQEMQSGNMDSISGSARSPGEGNGNPPQYSCLENPMDRGAWWATVHGVRESDITECMHVRTHTHTHTHISSLLGSLPKSFRCPVLYSCTTL